MHTLAKVGSWSEGFWEEYDSLWPGIILWLLTPRSLSPLSDSVFSFLCPCHDYSLEVRDKDWLFTLFLLTVNSSTEAHLSLISRNEERRLSWVQFSHSVMSDSATPQTAAHQASLSITNSWSPPKPMSIESVMPSNHLILCRSLLLLPSIFPSIRVFSNESALHIRWPKYWSFSFNISPSNEHPGLISFRMDWLGLLAVQGTL